MMKVRILIVLPDTGSNTLAITLSQQSAYEKPAK